MSSCTVCHIEYPSEDLARSQEFCEKIFGWQFRQFGDSMIVFSAGDGHIGGFAKGSRATGRMVPAVCYKVSDLDATLAQAQGLGAEVVDAKHPVPGVGQYASFKAPDGNEFGIVQFDSE